VGLLIIMVWGVGPPVRNLSSKWRKKFKSLFQVNLLLKYVNINASGQCVMQLESFCLDRFLSHVRALGTTIVKVHWRRFEVVGIKSSLVASLRVKSRNTKKIVAFQLA
jgi:hypothetical protein